MKCLLTDLSVDIETLAQRLSITPAMLAELANDNTLAPASNVDSGNVISMFAYRMKTA